MVKRLERSISLFSIVFLMHFEGRLGKKKEKKEKKKRRQKKSG